MPSERPAQRFQDIIDNIDDIDQFIRGIRTPNQLAADRRTLKAVLHSFMIIGEASSKLGDKAPGLCPEIPWHDVRNMANVIRHEYDGIDLPLVLWTIRNSLPPLRAACVAALEKLGR